jgi:hypothetical protein
MAVVSREKLLKEMESLRRAALEFRERLRKRALSTDSIWNAAVYECMALFGSPCGVSHRVEECTKCSVHEKLRGVLRLEASIYVPLKERMLSSLERMRQTSTLKGPEHAAYIQALNDVAYELNIIMEDFE